MGIEIERKFLVKQNDVFNELVAALPFVLIKQTYIALEPSRSVRVRMADSQGFITIKGIQNGISRAEFEYEIPLKDAEQLMVLGIHSPIIKKRYKYLHQQNLWEIDVFENQNKGLVMAEIELKTEFQQIELPSWISKEVTHDFKFSNLHLYQHPYQFT